MFKSARIKLTGWYLVIIMLVSISFSLATHRIVGNELDRLERQQSLRIQRGFPDRRLIQMDVPIDDDHFNLLFIDPKLINETKRRFEFTLIIVNVMIFGFSATAGYFLAGRTLQPIKEMVDDQARFITDASHELKTPITALRSEIEVNLRDTKMTLGQAKEVLVSNLEEVKNLQSLAEGLIRLSRFERSKGKNNWSAIFTNELVDEAIKKVSPLASSKGIKIVVSQKNFKILGDKQELKEAIVVILDNAIKFSNENSEIRVVVGKSDGMIRISIEDDGPGIDKVDLTHIFDRFYRAEKSRTKIEVPGFGLGLSIAKKIVNEHGGSIKVKSKLGVGSVFIICLPRIRRQKA